jgi:hypothetical protein
MTKKDPRATKAQLTAARRAALLELVEDKATAVAKVLNLSIEAVVRARAQGFADATVRATSDRVLAAFDECMAALVRRDSAERIARQRRG